MNNVLDSMQMFETSEDCNKFSKSVSYETLVGGTTTIGKDRKQTQRLCEYCAHKPLTAVGTLTSLLCNSAKVMEKWLQTLPVFRLVKIIILISVLSVGMIGESWADVISEQKCGNDCCWKIDGDTLTITGSGKMSDYNTTDNWAPWHSAENFTQVKNVVIDGLTSVGSYAFWDTSITKLTMSDTVTDIGGYAFAWSTSLADIKLSDSLKNLGRGAFRRIHLPTIVLPADVSIGIDSLGPYMPNIICKGNSEECKKLDNQLQNYEYVTDDGTYIKVPQDLSSKMGKIEQTQCDSTNYYWSGKECARRNIDGSINCASGYAEYKNKCWSELPFAKKRWTPAEANQWLHDGNDNFVVITFKK